MCIKKVWPIIIFLFLFTWMVTDIRGSEEEDKKEAERKALEEVVKTLKELSSAREKEISGLLMEGIEYYLKEEFGKAVTLFRNVLVKDPENKTARKYIIKGKEAFEKEKEKRVQREKQEKRGVSLKQKRIEAQKERLAEVYIARGDKYYRSQKLKLAIKQWEKALTIQPENAEAQKRILKGKHQLEVKGREADNEEKASNLIAQGKVYFGQGEYDQAIAEWEKVLNLVPGKHPDYERAESWIHVAEIYGTKHKEKQAVRRRDLSERSTLVGVAETWVPSERKKGEVEEEVPIEEEEKEAAAKLEEKTQEIVEVDFKNAHIRSILRTLAAMGGINIVLDEAVFPAGEEVLEGQTSPLLDITLKDLPLIEALRTILQAKNLVYTMEENLIWITTPQRLATEKLVTKVYNLLRTITGEVTFDDPGDEAFGGGEGGEEFGEGLETQPTAMETESFVDMLKESVTWPSGSVIKLDGRTGTLIIRNTPTNIGMLEEIIRKVETPPMQVSIEARFISIATEDLRQLGIEYPYIRIGLGEEGTLDIGRDTSYGISLPHMELGEQKFDEGEGLTLSYTKLGPTEFRLLLDAIEKTRSSNTLSAPKVMTRNQQEAVIKVVREYRFPERDAWQNFYYIFRIDLNDDGILDTWMQGVDVVPISFEVYEVGIVFTVTPDIGADMRTITLTLLPEIRRLGDWVSYQTILPVAAGTTGATAGLATVRFRTVYTERISTQIVIGDGETIVLGGLIEEEEEEAIRKVPLLGDIPILGRLFSRTVTRSEKKSLLIFITTYLVKPTGEFYTG